jgi:hypothetical protein
MRCICQLEDRILSLMLKRQGNLTNWIGINGTMVLIIYGILPLTCSKSLELDISSLGRHGMPPLLLTEMTNPSLTSLIFLRSFTVSSFSADFVYFQPFQGTP